jgi:hypothetical protein
MSAEVRRTVDRGPVPPPHAPDSFYDAHQTAVHRCVCRGCQRVFDVPLWRERESYVCSECAK